MLFVWVSLPGSSLETPLPRSPATVGAEVLGKVLLSRAEERVAGCFPALGRWCCYPSVLPWAGTRGSVDTPFKKRGLGESSPWEHPWLVSLSPEGLPSLPAAQSLLPPPLYLLCYQERHTFRQDACE